MTKITPERIVEISRYAEQGFSTAEIAKELGHSYSLIMQNAERHHINIPSALKGQLIKIRRGVAEGHSLYNIAQECNISPSLVIKYAKKEHIPLPFHELKPLTRLEIKILRHRLKGNHDLRNKYIRRGLSLEKIGQGREFRELMRVFVLDTHQED